MFSFLIKLLQFCTDVLLFIIIIDTILSYFKFDNSYKIIYSIRKIANVILKPIRAKLKDFDIGFDISPLIAIVILKILEAIIIRFFNILV